MGLNLRILNNSRCIIAQKDENCSRLLEPQTVAPNAKSCRAQLGQAYSAVTSFRKFFNTKCRGVFHNSPTRKSRNFCLKSLVLVSKEMITVKERKFIQVTRVKTTWEKM